MNGCLQVSGHSKGQADYQGARRRCLEDEVAKSRGIPGRQERLTEGAVLYRVPGWGVLSADRMGASPSCLLWSCALWTGVLHREGEAEGQGLSGGGGRVRAPVHVPLKSKFPPLDHAGSSPC